MTAPTPTQHTLSFSREIFAKLSPQPYLLAHLQPPSKTSPPIRANGRAPHESRPPHINTGSLTHVEGSAVVRIGDTTAVCGIRGEILLASNIAGYRVDRSSAPADPSSNEAQELDLLVPNIELATGCSPAFLPGQPPSTLAQSLATKVYSLLHSSRLVDDEDLRIWYQAPKMGGEDEMDEGDEEEAKAEVKAFWTLYIDVLFISLDGNPFDAAWAAVFAALRDVRLPKAYWDVEREKILCSGELELSKNLALRGFPIAVTTAVFKGKEQGQAEDAKDHTSWLLADPDTFEESLCDEVVTIVVDGDEQGRPTGLLGISKSGGTVVGQSEMAAVVEQAETRWKEWYDAVNAINST